MGSPMQGLVVQYIPLPSYEVLMGSDLQNIFWLLFQQPMLPASLYKEASQQGYTHVLQCDSTSLAVQVGKVSLRLHPWQWSHQNMMCTICVRILETNKILVITPRANT